MAFCRAAQLLTQACSDGAERAKRALFTATCRVRREVFPGGEVPGLPRFGSDPCPACGYQLSAPDQTFCVTCGHFDPSLRAAQPTAK